MTAATDIVRGQWLFTCRMEPVQFDAWVYSDVHEDGFYDYFRTQEGSEHSRTHCGLKTISEEYANWFIRHEMWQYFQFFQESRVRRHTQWVKRTHGLYTRQAVNGVTYWYVGRDPAVFASISYDGWRFSPSDEDLKRLGEFNTERYKWRLYDSYLQFCAERDGLDYEGH